MGRKPAEKKAPKVPTVPAAGPNRVQRKLDKQFAKLGAKK